MTEIVQRIALKSVITDEKGRVLLVREAKSYKDSTMTGIYTTPGGRLEPGEAWQDGIVRETKEETGLSVTPLRPVHLAEWRPIIQGTQNQIVAVYVECKYQGGDVVLSDEHDAYVWVTPSTWQDYTVADNVKDVLRVLFG